MEIITWIRTNSDFLYFVSTAILVIITGYYAKQTKEQVNYAHMTLNEENKRIVKTAINYCHLINSEMMAHKIIFGNYIYNEIKFGDVPNFYEKFSDFENLKYKTWDMIKSETPKYYSCELMEELVGYYSGIELMATFKYFNELQQKELIRSQFTSMYKCINLIESEFKIKLRTKETLNYDICTIKINKKNGEFTTERK